jgi:hypothetical protein
MAAITSVAIAAVSAGYSIYQGAKQKSEAKKALNNFDRQELDNVYADMPVSMVGSDFLAEQNSRTTASLLNGARQAGSRGIFSSIPRIQAFSNDANREGQAYLDTQFQERNRLLASDKQRIQGIQENRDNAELAGIGQQMEVGQAYLDQGIRGAGNALISGARNIDFTGDGSYNEQQGLTFDGLPKNGMAASTNPNILYTRATLDSIFSPRTQTPRLYNDYKPSPYGLNS